MKTVVIGSEKLTIEQVVAIAKRQVNVELDSSAEFQKKIDAGAEFLDEALAKHGGIYGVTTGYGDSCTSIRSLSGRSLRLQSKVVFAFTTCIS